MQDGRSRTREVRGDANERNRIDVGRKRNRIERNAARGELAGEVPRARFVLVQHQEANVPSALLQAREQREEVRLRAGDAGDLLQVQDGVGVPHRTASRTPSAQVSTE